MANEYNWQVEKTPTFIQQVEKGIISKEIESFIEAWARTAYPIQTNSNKLVYRQEKNVYEIWNARIPDLDHNKGKSSGFRLIYYIVKKEKELYLDLIEERRTFDDQKNKNKYDQYIKNLIRILNTAYGNNG